MKKILFLIYVAVSLSYGDEFTKENEFTKEDDFFYNKEYTKCEDVATSNIYEKEFKAYDKKDFGLDSFVGLALGVIAGSQVGDGSGKEAAAVAGGVIGLSIANSLREDNTFRYNYDSCGNSTSKSDKTKSLAQ